MDIAQVAPLLQSPGAGGSNNEAPAAASPEPHAPELHQQQQQQPPLSGYSPNKAPVVTGMSEATATGGTQKSGVQAGEGAAGGGGEGGVAVSMSDEASRRVKFYDGKALVAEFDDSNLWAHDPNEKALDMIGAYRRECGNLRIRPISKLLEQLERLDDLNTPIDTLDLKGVRLDNKSCEALEAVLSRMQMATLDVERANLEDEGAIAICEMVEFYGCASRIVLSANSRLRPRAWLTIGRMLKKSPFIEMINVNYCALEEQTLTLLLRSVRANCNLKILKMEGNTLAGKGTFILLAAMKFNENLQELWLGNNHLSVEDGQHLGSILRTNHTLKLLDVRSNNLMDAGVRYICAGVAEQQEGLLTLNLQSNNIGMEGFHHISAMLPCTKSLRDLNVSQNRCGDNGLFMLKLGLLANRSLEKLNLSTTKMTCEGAIALAEVLAESKHITNLDIKENDIRVAGLLALQLAHRMNHTLLCMDTPKTYKVEPRDRSLIKDFLMEIDRYCARNLSEREERLEAERKRAHEAQHAQQGLKVAEATVFTAGESVELNEGEEEEEKEVDPSLVGSLDNVLPEPGAEMEKEKDPFKGAMMDDKEKPTSLLEMERSLDAMVAYREPGSPSGGDDADNDDFSSLDSGTRPPLPQPLILEQQQQQQQQASPELLPDLLGVSSPLQPPPDVAAASPGNPHPTAAGGLPPDLAVGAQRSVDLLDEASPSGGTTPPTSQPVDLTEGLFSRSS